MSNSKPTPSPAPAYHPTERHPQGREARVLDIVETEIDVGSYANIPVIAQVVCVLPKTGRAEIALLSRPSGMAGHSPRTALQNLAARIVETDLKPIEDLRLRSRASRPLARCVRAVLESKPG